MSKTTKEAAMAEDTAIAATETVELTLVEFCARLSATVRRPELIGGFESAEKLAGKVKATAEAFQADFEDFCNKPV